jgi:hypothetical protein
VFYKIHRFFYKAQGQKDGAVIAMITLSCFFGLNILTILTFLEGCQILPIINLNKFHVIGLGLLLFLLCYLLFLKKKRYIEIEHRFINEPAKKKVIGTLLVWLYLILSFVLFSVSSMIRYNLTH